MAKREKYRRTLEEVLRSAAHVIYPNDDLSNRDRVPNVRSRASDGDTVLHHLVFRGDRWGVKLVIEAGAEVNAVGDLGYTPLHLAAMAGDVQTIQMLLDAGARRDVTCEFGETPMDLAERAGPEVARAIRQHRPTSRPQPE